MAETSADDLAFFHEAGIYVRDGFLPARRAGLLTRQAVLAPGEPGVIGVEGGIAVAEHVRRVETLDISPRLTDDLERRVRRIRLDLEAYFGLALGWSEPVTVLRYRAGDFYRPHRDRVNALDPFYGTRRISAVLFANGPSDETGTDGFVGGALRFHDVATDGMGHPCAVDLLPAVGSFVAFRSETLHEVLPVEDGVRVTAVTWFHAA
jgi:predicted 2-oxoglutarate/Fe(II)-dependent dioxygenase YbiX